MWCWCFLFDQHESCRTQKCRCGMCVVRKPIIGLTGRFKTSPLTIRQFSSSAFNLPRNLYKCYFTCTLSHTHGCTCKCRTVHACISLTTCQFSFTFQLLQIMLVLLVLLWHSLGSQNQHRNGHYSASHWGLAMTLCHSCWRHLEGFWPSTLRAPPWATMVSLLQIYVSSKSTCFSVG